MVWIITSSRTLSLAAELRLGYDLVWWVQPDDVVVHGGCIGGDALAGELAMQIGCRVHCVLPADHSRVASNWEALCTSYEQMPAGTDYRARNARLLEIGKRRGGTLRAYPMLPETHPGSQRSGTWMTVRMARRMGVEVVPVPLWGDGRA